MALICVRRREVGRVDEDRPADVDDRRRADDPLAVHRDPLRAGEPQLLDRVRTSRAETSASTEPVGAVLESEGDAGAGDGDQARPQPRGLEVGVQLAEGVGGARVEGLELADVLAQPKDHGS